MARKERTPDRAKAIIDRAARMKAFKPSLSERRAFDTQMKTPGKRSKPLEINSLPAERFEKVGRASINPRDIISDQPTVSRDQVKGKIDKIAAGENVSVRLIKRPDGKYQMLDGNHGTTAHRAMGRNVEADIYRIRSVAEAEQFAKAKAASKVAAPAQAAAPKAAAGAGKAVKMGGKVGLALAVAGGAAYLFAGKAKADDAAPTNGTGVAPADADRVASLIAAGAASSQVAQATRPAAPAQPIRPAASRSTKMTEAAGKVLPASKLAPAQARAAAPAPGPAQRSAEPKQGPNRGSFTRADGTPGKREYTQRQIAAFKARRKAV